MAAALLVLADIRTGAGPAVTWMSLEDGRITAVGSGPPPPAARTLDLGGAVVLPGFIDMHAHPAEGGREAMGLDLSGVTLVEELVLKVAYEVEARCRSRGRRADDTRERSRR